MLKINKIILIAIFLLSFVTLVVASKKDSITTDEGVHLFAGVTYLNEKDFRLDPEHPPLLKELGALPVIFLKNLQYELGTSWEKASDFSYDSWREARSLGDNFVNKNAESIILIARLPLILLTLLLGVLTYFWAKKLFSEKVAIFAAFLILFFPNILAHGHLINTDLGLTLFLFATVYFWGRYLEEKQKKFLYLTGLFTGLVLASKFTGIIVFPILFALAITQKYFNKEEIGYWLKSHLTNLVWILAISFLIIFAAYGFSFEQVAYYVKGMQMVTGHAFGGHDSFFLGMVSNKGWWYYFPVLILFKTPLAIFLMLFIVLFNRINNKKINFNDCWLLLPPLIFLIFAMTSKANLGVRHVLPVFPFLTLYASQSLDYFGRKWKRYIFLIIAWYLLSFASAFPNFISYYNELAGGPNGGYRIANDSNLDWGQNVYRLKKFMGDKNYYLVYNWNGADYLLKNGISFTRLDAEDRLENGEVIITTSELVGKYSWLVEYPKVQIIPGVFLISID